MDGQSVRFFANVLPGLFCVSGIARDPAPGGNFTLTS
jgi:hypothetical protein